MTLPTETEARAVLLDTRTMTKWMADVAAALSGVAVGIPAGGTTGQVLTKESNADGDADWETPATGAVPNGGTTRQVLTKASGADQDADWEDTYPIESEDGTYTTDFSQRGVGAGYTFLGVRTTADENENAFFEAQANDGGQLSTATLQANSENHTGSLSLSASEASGVAATLDAETGSLHLDTDEATLTLDDGTDTYLVQLKNGQVVLRSTDDGTPTDTSSVAVTPVNINLTAKQVMQLFADQLVLDTQGGTQQIEILSATSILLDPATGQLNLSDAYADIGERAAPGNPAANTLRLYVVDNAGTTELHAKDSAGTGYTLVPPAGGGGGNVATDTIFDAKGDLAVGTGADTAAKLTVGANDTMPLADSAETTGIKWGTPTTVKTALGLTIGTNVQAFDQDLTDIAAVTRTRGDLIVGGASAWTDLAIGASPKFLGTDGTDPIWRNGTRVISLDTGGTYNLTGSALTIATHTVPGALLAVGDLLSLEIAFYYLNNTTVNQGPVLTIDFGSTAGFFSATNSALATNANPRQMFLRSTFIATAVGNPATVSSSTLYQMGNVATATTASNIPAAANDQFGTNVDSAQDSGSNITIAVKMNGANTATHQVITRASVLVHTPKW